MKNVSRHQHDKNRYSRIATVDSCFALTGGWLCPATFIIFLPFETPTPTLWAFSIYKKFRKISIGNFRLGRARSIRGSRGTPGRFKDREGSGPGDKNNKNENSVNGTQIFHWEVSTGKTGLPFQQFRLFRKIFSGTNQKVVFHLHPNRNFRNFLVNGKRPLSPCALKHVMWQHVFRGTSELKVRSLT